MPKKFSPSDKSKWLEKYESGKSESSIAKESTCDIRTIRKGIEEARCERDARAARVDLIKQAIFNHQESLLSKLGEILSTLTVPLQDWTVRSWHECEESILSESDLDTEDLLEDEVSKNPKYSVAKADMVESMLRQHLKNDKLPKILARWEKAYASHRLDRIALQRKVVNLLEEETGYKLEEGGNVRPPFLCSYTTCDLFYRMTLYCAFGNYKGDEWQDEIVADTATGLIRYCNLILADVPSKADRCRKKLLDAFQEMKTLSEVTRVVTTYRELEESTFRAKQAIEEIRLLGIVPGQCKICRRLGM
jgi:uncharacterized protein YcbK (DUF882 family)